MVLVASAGLIFGSSGPAAAATVIAGAGTGGGFEEGDFHRTHGAADEDCDLPQEGAYGHSRFYLTHASTYEGADTDEGEAGTATGLTEWEILTEHHYAAPQGTNRECPDPLPLLEEGVLVPGPVTITQVDIDQVAGVGDVDCHSGPNQDLGWYMRVGTAITMSFSVQCTFLFFPTGLVVTEEVTHYLEGQMVPCGFDEDPITQQPLPNTCIVVTDDPNATSIVESTFEASNATPVLPEPPL